MRSSFVSYVIDEALVWHIAPAQNGKADGQGNISHFGRSGCRWGWADVAAVASIKDAETSHHQLSYLTQTEDRFCCKCSMTSSRFISYNNLANSENERKNGGFVGQAGVLRLPTKIVALRNEILAKEFSFHKRLG